MRKADILLGIVAWGFVLNGAAKILFANWFQNSMHYPIDGDSALFSVLEMASGFIILLRRRFSKVVGSFSRIAGLLYAGFSLSVAVLLPFLGKEFQYLSVKVLNLIYFCFYLFCLSVLSNRSIKALFPSVEERIFPETSQVSYGSTLDEKMIQRISFWVKLIAILLILDSFSLSILSYGLKPYLGMNA